jgi:hypothetical protein
MIDLRLQNLDWVPDRGREFVRHRAQTDSDAHPVSYRMSTGFYFPRGKAVGCEIGQIASIIHCLGKDCVELQYIYSQICRHIVMLN